MMGTTHAQPGRLGNPDETLASDPRTDPRLVAALEPFGLGGHGEPLPLDASAPTDQLVAFCNAAEAGFQQVFDAMCAELAPVTGVERSTETITGVDGNEITLYIHRPSEPGDDLPGILHIHGGGMVILTAADVNYARWRDHLAAEGLVVVGVEYRNGAGVLGPHPFPAGLDDCSSALDWMDAHRGDLGISTIVVSGESGGGNLTIATTLKAKQDGRLAAIDGVYAQCPYISGMWAQKPAEIVSMTENDEYFIGTPIMGVMAAVYDPSGEHARNPLAWPYHASVDDLSGLPPHVISVNELDPLRDEGLAYARRLLRAGVSVVSRTVNGTCHAGDLLLEGPMNDVYRASLRDVVGFAEAL
ncbi:MAG: alpha/beta hydrolase fold domain-containing protein [Ilumatobacteraceae bacterium]